jgi:hypothetical protein
VGRTVDNFEPLHFGIKKKAMQKWLLLSEGMNEHPNFPCKNNSYYYTDYDGYGFEDEDGSGKAKKLTEEQCEQLCTDCPLIKLCYDFAVAQEVTHGVWGGINFGAENDAKEGKLF